MGLIKNRLRDRIRKKLDANGVVVWYDKTGEEAESPYFQRFVEDELQFPEAEVVVYNGSFLRVRHDLLDPLTQDRFAPDGTLERPHVLVYIPRDRDVERSPLLDVELMGGQGSVIEGTPWKVIEESLRGEHDDAVDRDAIKKMVESQFSLDRVDTVTEEVVEVDARVAAVFDTKDPVQIGLRFAADDTILSLIEERRALAPLTSLLGKAFGFKGRDEENLTGLREAFRNHLLISEVLEALAHKGSVPQGLQSVPLPTVSQLDKVSKVLDQWRSRRDLADAYVGAAERCEVAYDLPLRLRNVDIPWDLETVPCVEDLILQRLEEEAEDLEPETLLEFARHRKDTIWAQHESRAGSHWAMLEACAQLLIQASHVEGEVRQVDTIDTLLERYRGTKGEGGWFRLDQEYRKLEHHLAQLQEEPPLPTVIARARRAYLLVVDELVGKYVRLFEKAGTVEPPSGFLSQKDVYRREVATALEEGSVAYLLVDALRYEMGDELATRLERYGSIELKPAVAALPTITRVGMAALLPHANLGFDLIEAGGKIQVRINGEVFDSVQSRGRYLLSASGVPGVEILLEDLIRNSKRVQEQLKGARLVVIRSQESDAIGEKHDLETAHEMMTRILDRLEKAVIQLTKASVDRIVITADHGYLFVENLEEARRLHPPGGQQLELHRRVWIGRGGENTDQTVRISAEQLGYSGNFDLVFPRGAAVFKAGGSLSYFHGGLSPQEMVVPVITTLIRSEDTETGVEHARVSLRRAAITTGVFLADLKLVMGTLPRSMTRRVRIVAQLDPHPEEGETQVADLLAATEALDPASQQVEVQYGEPHTLVFQMRADAPRTGALVIRVIDPATEVELGRSEPVQFEQSIF